MLEAISGCDGVVTLLSDVVDEEFLQHAGPRLRVIANYAVGYDNVDIACARRHGVVVTNTPGVLDEATADLTLALILATARRVVEADRFVRSEADWAWRPDFFTGLDLSAGCTLGIVGVGRIGLAVARRARAFGMEILGTPTRSGADEAARLGIVECELHDLLERSDVVTLHCPYSAATHHLISEAELDLIGPDGVLVNTARGAIVDEADLIRALSEGRLGAAGLDVYAHEPLVPARLRELPNTVLVPHIGSAGRATREQMADLAIANIAAVLENRPAPSPVG
jgi:glyoxylate reductase